MIAVDPVIPRSNEWAAVVFLRRPDPAVVERARDTGADGIEIAGSTPPPFGPVILLPCCGPAPRRGDCSAQSRQHRPDLNLDNLPPLTAALPGFAETSMFELTPTPC
jgi:hypothetical protein